MKPDMWFRKVIELHNIHIVNLSIDILIAANKLPWHHRDPADRFIISSAIQENATIVTGDQKFSKYDIDVII